MYRVNCFRSLGTIMSQDLIWTTNIMSLVKKKSTAVTVLFKRANLPQPQLLSFYKCSIENILMHNVLLWFSKSMVCCKRRSWTLVKYGQSFIKITLPSLTDVSEGLKVNDISLYSTFPPLKAIRV